MPLEIFVLAPSCVPPIKNDFETVGMVIDTNAIEELFKMDEVYGLGEVMDYYGLLNGDKDLHRKIQLALKYNKVVTGHAAGLSYKELSAYAAASVSSCHEATNSEEVIARAKLSMYAMIRYGSAWHDLPKIVKQIIGRVSDMRRFMFITDYVHPEDLVSKGYLNYVVKRAIEEGF